MYIAHTREDGKIQTLKDHSYGVAKLSRSFAIEELKEYCYLAGLLHDVGKYQESFQRRIRGSKESVEHSTTGSKLASVLFGDNYSLMMQLCIMGHHTGLPDMGFITDSDYESTFFGRRKREFEDISDWKKDIEVARNIDEKYINEFLKKDIMTEEDIKILRGRLIDKFAFMTRFIFSCLVDADSIDTANFMNDEEFTFMESDFKACLNALNKKVGSFTAETELQKTRSKLQSQVYEKIDAAGEVFFMNMPTGSGKTLCSVKFALSRNKKRIIYIIPYNSIIDQTAEVFENMFKDKAQIIRAQSTFSYDEEINDEDFIQKMEKASENWSGDFILTTAVNFFESLHSNKRRELRKVHNIKDAILVFDEAHTLPEKFLKPCLEVISYLTKYCNCEALFLTATMPNFKELFQKLALPNIKMLDLITDKSDFLKFKKAQFKYIGEISDDSLIEKAMQNPSALIIVNNKKTARELYKDLIGEKYHLSTYMVAKDRMDTINLIKKRLGDLKRDFPMGDVPEDRRIIVVSTSLIEAGVDLDFHAVFRELSGLESILQAGGRCNREGLRSVAEVSIFQRLGSEYKKPSIRENIALRLLKKYEDIEDPEAILEYYNELFFFNEELISSKSMDRFANSIKDIPFDTYAKEFKLIDGGSIGIIAPIDEGIEIIDRMRYSGIVDYRKAQKYSFSVNKNEFEELLKYRRIEDFDTGVYVLRDEKYYNKEIGVIFEQKEINLENNSGYLL